MNDLIEQKIREIYSFQEVISNPTCYLYDLNDIKDKIRNIEKNAPSNLSVYYAMKANPNPEILKYIKKFNFVRGIEIASLGELEKAKKVYNASDIIFTGPGKTYKELGEAIVNNIKLINCESIVEAYRINQIAFEKNIKVDILLRINTDYFIDGADEHMAGCSTKMGIDEKEFVKIYQEILNYGNLNIKGIHVFSASGVLEYTYLIKYVKYVFDLVKRLEYAGFNIEIIDFGGGIGIDYTKRNRKFDITSYFAELNELIDIYKFRSKELILELGKYIVGECGYYTTKIIDIKNNKGHRHIITAGGVNHMRLPIATDRKHPVYIIHNNEPHICKYQESVKNDLVDIEGPLCMDEDKISWDEKVEYADIGDVVVLTQSGAYCYTASTLWFLSHEMPKEFILNEKGEIYEA
nr:hypothetical protein [Bacilli bacterium]